jgi:hypothetical protein
MFDHELVDHRSGFGLAVIDEKGRAIDIEERPKD